MRKYDPTIDLDPPIYEAWIKEKPKIIEGGPLILTSNANFEDSDDVDNVILLDYKMESEILPPHYAEKLIIHGHSTDYEGFNLWVTVMGFDYLLMAHRNHYGNPFITIDKQTLYDHPHFHELDYYNPRRRGAPGKRYIAPNSLYPGMRVAELLEVFMRHYYINDGRTEIIGDPDQPPKKHTQKGLHDY